jgi:hypothetical protein
MPATHRLFEDKKMIAHSLALHNSSHDGLLSPANPKFCCDYDAPDFHPNALAGAERKAFWVAPGMKYVATGRMDVVEAVTAIIAKEALGDA